MNSTNIRHYKVHSWQNLLSMSYNKGLYILQNHMYNFLVILTLLEQYFFFESLSYTLFTFQIDVAGTLYFWDVTIDTASSILLTLSVGLAVDYSAHIGHTYMTILGDKNGMTLLSWITIINFLVILWKLQWKYLPFRYMMIIYLVKSLSSVALNIVITVRG